MYHIREVIIRLLNGCGGGGLVFSPRAVHVGYADEMTLGRPLEVIPHVNINTECTCKLNVRKHYNY